jgi:LEA14-like dessication related protein
VPEVSFGNVFIDTELVKEVKVTNKNEQPILFEWDTSGNATLKNTNCALTKIEAGTTKTFRIVFKPNSLGTVSLPLGYVINRHHSFELPVTAFVTLINVGLSTKIIELSFSPDDIAFQKSQSF